MLDGDDLFQAAVPYGREPEQRVLGILPYRFYLTADVYILPPLF